MRYLISYELIAPGRDYQPLWNAFGQIGAKRVLLAQWTVRNKMNAAGLRDYLRQYLDANDRLLVICLDSTDWASWNTLADLNAI